jgi:hypothetical protein
MNWQSITQSQKTLFPMQLVQSIVGTTRRETMATTCLLVLLLQSLAPPHARALVVDYAVRPGSEYTYLPSDSAPIPGCEPDELACRFAVLGRFRVDYDQSAGWASLLNLELDLIGNAAIQETAPPGTIVTAGSVADLLSGRVLDQLPVLGPFDLYSDGDFYLWVIGSHVTLSGGYDNRAAGADAVHVDFVAHRVPESNTATFMVLGGLLLWLTQRHRAWRLPAAARPSTVEPLPLQP